ncbi:hypothetical protein [Bacillus mycoides]|uniref:hypothetical protein n=1 Tax=Bacillus mycoides TaxID=1405 RepID=UPI002079A251|nr:hypothetical protein [Bacillus mycoides]
MKILTDKQLESLLWNAEQKGYDNGCAKGFKFGYEEGRKPGVTHKQSNDNEEPLLQIVQSDMDAVPVVLYKGEEIKGKVRISFDWKTDGQYHKSGPYIHIEHVEDSKKCLNTKTLQHNHSIAEEQVKLYWL